MPTWWEIYADADGALIVERHGGQWVFVPNGPVGRPRKKPVPAAAVRPEEILPHNMHLDSWKVS